MNAKTGKLSRKLVQTLALVLVAVFVVSIPAASTDTAMELGQELQTVRTRTQGFTGEDVALAGADAWAQAEVEISDAPDDAVVSTVRVKYHIADSKPSDLEVHLLNSGAELSHALWNRESAEGTVLAQSSEEITAFQGTPVNGTWSLGVQGGESAGYIDDFSIVIYYDTEMPILQVEVEGEGTPGTPAFLRLPEDVAPNNLAPDNDEESSSQESSVTPQHVPPGATIIETMDFEGDFYPPGGYPVRWRVADQSDDGYQRWWDDAQCDPCGGDWAAWPADGGANGVYPCAGNDYPNRMEAWMVYGPFDLSDANDAGTEFSMWHRIEAGYDYVFFGVSSDGVHFSGLQWDGSANCTLYNIGYTDWVGDPSVWVAWMFRSDSSVTYAGPWVDNIVVWKTDECATVKVDPPESFPDRGSTFTVDVAIEDAQNLGAFEFELTYDPTCIQAVDASLGPFLGSTGRSVAPVGPTLRTGSITFGGYSWGSAAGPNGDGVLASISFLAGPNECDSTLHLQNVTLTDTAGGSHCIDHTEDGTAHVKPGCHNDCPEDINGDRVIDIVDIMLVADKWGQHCPTR